MSTETPQIIVVTEEKKKRRGALLLVAGGAAALLAGGSTFALWSATDGFSGGRITAGDLDVVQTADTTFWDVSADRDEATATVTGTDGSQLSHALSPTDASTWRIVPGDKVAASFSADVTLEGDNLVGRLALDGPHLNEYDITGMTYTYEIYQDGALVQPEIALPVTADATLLYLSAPEAGQDAGLEDANGTTVLSMAATTEDLTVVVYGTFSSTVTDRIDVTLTDTLSGLNLRLEQVRDTGEQF